MIAKSTLRIGCSPLVPYGKEWIIAPDKQIPLIKPPTTWAQYQLACAVKLVYRLVRFLGRNLVGWQVDFPAFLREYELRCIHWYVEETYAMAEIFKSLYPGIKYYEVDICDLNSLEEVCQMLAYFGCAAKEGLRDVVGKSINQKIGWHG
jgi:hypothetical protein